MDSLSSLLGECLRGSHEAFLALDRQMRPQLVSSLQNRGASHSLAEEIAADVLGDCSAPGDKSLLMRYNGKGEFKSWLLRVGINRLIDRQRRQSLFQEQDPKQEAAEPGGYSTSLPDSALRGIVLKALAEAFASCAPQARVLLWLRFVFSVKQARLADAWGWSESKLSRTLSTACDEIRDRTLEAVRRIEPGLTLEWEDIIDTCADMNAALFSRPPN